MRRYALALTLVASLATTASACPKDKDVEDPPPPPPPPVCNLLVDPRGDALLQSLPLDILSGDVATNLERLVAVLRVASLDTQDPATALGARWDLSFQVYPGTSRYTLTARRDAAGAVSGTLTREGGGALPVPVMLDAGQSQVSWSVPREYVKELHTGVLGKTFLFDLTGRTYAGPADMEADVANAGKRKYTDGYPTCLKI